MTFQLQHTDTASDARTGIITTAHGQIKTPIFMPVGTCGTVKGVHFSELREQVKARLLQELELGNRRDTAAADVKRQRPLRCRHRHAVRDQQGLLVAAVRLDRRRELDEVARLDGRLVRHSREERRRFAAVLHLDVDLDIDDVRLLVRVRADDVHRLHELADGNLADVGRVVEHVAALELAAVRRIRADGEVHVSRCAR